MSIKNLDRLFNPKKIFIYGNFTSNKCRGIEIINNITKNNFNGSVYTFSSPNQFENYKIKNINDINEISDLDIDISFFTGDITQTYNFLQKLKKLPANIILTNGLLKNERIILQNLLEYTKIKNSRVIGLNSIGLIIPSLKLNASLYPSLPQDGDLVLISQSGAVTTTILDYALKNNIGFKFVINIGSIIDTDFGDLIDFMWNIDEVKSLLLYIEKVKNPKKFLSAARSVSRIKPITALKSAKNELSIKILEQRVYDKVGKFIVYDNAFRRAGIIRVEDITELINAGQIFTKIKIPTGDKLCIITNSGGIGILALDYLFENKLKVKEIPESISKQIKNLLEIENINNPIDIGGRANQELYDKISDICINSNEFDTVIIIMVLNGLFNPWKTIEAIEKNNKYNLCNLIYICLGGNENEKQEITKKNTQNLNIFFNLEDGIKAYAYSVRYRHKLEKLIAVPPQFRMDLNFNYNQTKEIIEKNLKQNIFKLNYVDSFKILENYKMPLIEKTLIKNLDESFIQAEKLGYPVNLLILTNNNQNKELKTITSPRMLKKTYHEIVDFKKNFKVYLVEFIKNYDIKLRAGIDTDDEYGPYIFLGLGGKYKIISENIAIMLPPLNSLLAKRMIEKFYLYNFLKELKLIEPLEDILIKLSYLSSNFSEIRKLTLDPIINDGNIFKIVDFEIILQKSETPAPKHFAIAPYPNQYEFYETLPDGTKIFIRPIKPEDEPLHFEFFYSLSKETNYYRFFSYRKELTHEQIARFTQIDYDREIAIVAIVNENGKDKIVGVNRLVYYPHEEKYEFAIVVTDSWQKKGVGKVLMDKLIQIAKDKRIKEIYGSVLAENTKMIRFSKKFGFEIVDNDGEIIYIKLELDK